jgi:hypothetical protein
MRPDLFTALQAVAKHCETSDVACAGVLLASSALCSGCKTLEEAEDRAEILGGMMLDDVRINWRPAIMDEERSGEKA